MAQPAPQASRRLQRRDALRLLAASSGAVAGGSLIVSGPAHADSGSATCRFEFSSPPQVTYNAFNTFLGDFFGIDTTVVGTCPCGSLTSIEYAYTLVTTNANLSTGGWVASAAANVSFADLFPAGGGTFTLSAAVRVTCTGPAGVTVRCRYSQTASIAIGPTPFSTIGGVLELGTNNGDDGLAGLPACGPAALASNQLRFRSASSGGAFWPGPLILPDDVQRLRAGELPDNALGGPLDPAAPTEAPTVTPTETPTDTPSETPIETPTGATGSAAPATPTTTAPAGPTTTTTTTGPAAPSTSSTTPTTTPPSTTTP